MNLYNRFNFFLQHEFSFKNPKRIVLAISGGIDSMVMLNLFQQTEHAIAVAHCNFGLRGNESEGDHSFVKEHCAKHSISFFDKRFDTLKYVSESKTSIQEAARELRYNWFTELLNLHQFDFIATAHHLNDVTETLLFNITRGTGIAGLHGIPSQNSKIIRPLLFATRNEIEEYAHEYSVPFRKDSSNESNKYSRNKIRNFIIPVLKDINPALEENVRKLTQQISFVEKIYRNHINEVWEKCSCISGDKTALVIADLLRLEDLSFYLFEFLHPYGFNSSQVTEIIASLNEHSGKQFFTNTHLLIKDRESLLITKHKDEKTSEFIIENISKVLTTGNYAFDITSLSSEDPIEFSENTFYVDTTNLSFPLRLRKWKHGDKFIPLGMNNYKNVSDFFIDKKVNLIDKNKSLVLCSQDGEIMCVLPYRIDNRFKVTSQSKNILKIKVTSI